MILEQVIEKAANEQLDRLNSLDQGLIREKNLNLKSIQSHALIITDVRRIGKSTLLMQIMRNLDQTFFLNFETPLLYGFSINDFDRLDRIIKKKNAKWLFFDEIQTVIAWELYIRKKLDEGFHIIISGSNA